MLTLLDREAINQIRLVERSIGRTDFFATLVGRLESSVTDFGQAFAECLARGDTRGAQRAAHSLKGMCLQLGASALGQVFADIESCAKGGDYAAARRMYDTNVALIAQSFEALKSA